MPLYSSHVHYRFLSNMHSMIFITHILDGPTSGEVRLYSSLYRPSVYGGRVEVFMSGEWGTVTGLWTQENAEVVSLVCHQLGFKISSKIIIIMLKALYIYVKKVLQFLSTLLMVPMGVFLCA